MNFKNFFACVLACCVVGVSFPFYGGLADNSVIMASAADEYTEGTYELLTYKNYGDYIEISGCDESAVSVVIPAEIDGVPVTSLDTWAFSYHSELTSISIPSSVTNLYRSAFIFTPWYESKLAEDPLFIVNGILVDGTTCSGDVVIPESVTSINGGAFINCPKLTKITIPNSVTNIGEVAFASCSGLTEIIIPDSVTNIGSGAFRYCTELRRISIPDGIRSIESETFSNCTRLTNVTIPNSVTSIGNNAFYYCSYLDSITLPESVADIGKIAFFQCSSLTDITILNPNCEIYDELYTITTDFKFGEYNFYGTIYGYENSTAQAYAEKYNRKFVSLGKADMTIIKGDVNNNGAVDADDASLVLADYALQQTGHSSCFTKSQLKAADVNGDGAATASDASLILGYYAYVQTGGKNIIDEWLNSEV